MKELSKPLSIPGVIRYSCHGRRDGHAIPLTPSSRTLNLDVNENGAGEPPQRRARKKRECRRGDLFKSLHSNLSELEYEHFTSHNVTDSSEANQVLPSREEQRMFVLYVAVFALIGIRKMDWPERTKRKRRKWKEHIDCSGGRADGRAGRGARARTRTKPSYPISGKERSVSV